MNRWINGVRQKGQPLKSMLLPVWYGVQQTSAWQKYMAYQEGHLEPRSTHAYCIGLPKSGTHSIARMLDCRSAHEPETHTLLNLFADHKKSKISREDQRRVLRSRDTWLWLELESNWLLGLVLEALVAEFPQAKYILTVREPIAWLESEINQEIAIRRYGALCVSIRAYVWERAIFCARREAG